MSIKGPYEIVHYFVGLSTDTKPTETAVLGDRFFESDTRLWYIYDGTSWSMLNEEFSLSLYGKCSSTMTASTTELVVPTLVGYGDDFFNNKFYIQILKNANSVGNAPEIQVRKITDYVSTTGTFTVDAFGANVEASDEIVVLHESLVAIGRDDSDNVFASTNVGANADGSILERLEWIQVAIGGAAGQLRTVNSESEAVEENAVQYFSIGIFDVDAGAIASANIDITSISAVLEKSTGGGGFSSVGITQPTFAKTNGSVYCAYQFLAAEWGTGDMYKLVVGGITATLHSVTAYVPTAVWSNVVVETADIDANVEYIVGVVDDLHTDVGTAISNIGDVAAVVADIHDVDLPDIKTDTGTILTDTEKLYDVTLGVAPVDGSLASFLATGGTALGTRLPVSTSLYDTTKNINVVGITSAPVANTLSDTLHKDDSFTYDNTTDSLEAISDKVSLIPVSTASGVLQLAATTEDLQQAASTYDLFTGTTQAVVVEKVVLAVPNVDVSDDATITYITIQTDHSTPQVIFNSTSGAKANLTAEAQLSWTGAIYLPAGKKIQLTIAGGAADAPTVCNITAQYRAVVAGGTLA